MTRSERTGRWNAYLVETRVGRFFGLVKCRRREVRVLDGEGVIRLQKGEGDFTTFPCGELERALPAFVEAHTSFSDAGAIIPKVRLYFRQRAVDLSGVNDRDQLMALAQMECDALDDSTQILAVATHE